MKTIFKILGVLVLTCLAVLAVPVLLYFPGHNFRVVEKGAFYGSRQMSGPALERTIAKRGIKTVVNCRGENFGSDWYDAEAAACERTGTALYSFGWSKNSIPDPESLKAFIEMLDTAEKPILAHCQGGTHRTGAAAAIYLLAKGESAKTARGQFGPMFNNAPIGQLVDLYEASGLPFRQFVTDAYPAAYAQWKSARDAAEAAQAATPAPATP